MITDMFERSTAGRFAIAGLATGLLGLVALATWNNASSADSVSQVRQLNAISAAWVEASRHIQADHRSARHYVAEADSASLQRLSASIGAAQPNLRWIEEHGDPANASAAERTRYTYARYTDLLRQVLRLRAAGDQPGAERRLREAEQVGGSLATHIADTLERQRRQSAQYVETLDRRHRLVAAGGAGLALVDLALLLFCAAVLLGYQRRVERQAVQSGAERDTVVAFAAATSRDQVIDTALAATLRLDPQLRGAVIGALTGSTVQFAGAGEWETAGQRTAERTHLPTEVADSLGRGSGALFNGAEVVALTRAMGLPPLENALVAPLSVGGESFGLLVAGSNRPLPTQACGSIITLAYETAATLDRLLLSQRLRVIVEHSCDLLLLANEQRIIQLVNPAARRALGYPAHELVGRELRSIIHADDYDQALNPAADPSAPPTATLCRLCRHDGQPLLVELAIGRVQEHDGSTSFVINARDVSERQRLEIELRHAQKLESVGRLAAGLAHEINTPVQFVGDNVRFLESSFNDLLELRRAYSSVLTAANEPERLPAALSRAHELESELDVDFIAEEIPTAIHETLDGIDRVATIVRAMKAFGYTTSEEMASIDLNDAIRNTLIVARSELAPVADVHTDLAELPPIRCYAADINQVLLNLLANAAHAVARTPAGRGRIRINTRRDGDHAVIEVADTGVGIPDEVADKVFEAFFTTNDVGVGTGQGLTLCRSLIVDRHGGTIHFTSTPGEGTTFTVRLPIAGGGRSASAGAQPAAGTSRGR